MTHTSFTFHAARLPPVVSDPDAVAVAQWAREELDAIMHRLNQPIALTFDEQHHAPEKPRVGLVVYADGTDWNPGSGEGLYVYKSGGWTLIA